MVFSSLTAFSSYGEKIKINFMLASMKLLTFLKILSVFRKLVPVFKYQLPVTLKNVPKAAWGVGI